MNNISIIIPLHNSIMYMDDCLHSILPQISKDDEIILIENGSTDNTPEKAKEYLSKYSNIKYIELGPVGVSVARNEGIKAATKEWITFVDSDDMLQEGALDILLEQQSKIYEIVIADHSNRIIHSQIKNNSFNEVNSTLLLKGVFCFSKYKKRIQKKLFLRDDSNWTCWGKYYKREFLQNNQIFFPEGVALSEDALFLARCYAKAKKVAAVGNIIYCYRLTPGSVCRVYNEKKYLNNFLLCDTLKTEMVHFTNCRKEITSFIANKFIEIIFSLRDPRCVLSKEKKEEIVNKILLDKERFLFIKEAKYLYIVNGRKNNINYAKILYFLKRRKIKRALNCSLL